MVALAVFYAAYFSFVGLYSPYFGPYLKSMGHSVQTIGWALALMQSMRIIGPQAWGWLSDVTGRRVVWLRWGALLGLSFAILLFWRVQEAYWVLLFAVLCNSAMSGLVPLSDAHAMQACGSDLGRYGKLRLWGSLGFILSVVGFGQWASVHSLQDYPWVVCVCLLMTLCAGLLMREPTRDPVHGNQPTLRFASLFAQPGMRWFWASSFCMVAAHGSLYGFYSLYLQHHGYGTDVIGAMWAIGVVAEVAFFWFQGRFFSKLPVAGWLQWALLACALRFALVAAFPTLLWLMALTQVLHALTFAAHHSAAMAFLRTHCGPRLLGRGQALYTGIAYGAGGFLGTVLAGRVWGWLSPSYAFWMACAFGLLGWACARAMSRADRLCTP